MASTSKKQKTKHEQRHFLDSWLSDKEFHEWLIKETDSENKVLMKCKFCCDANLKNAFTKGCNDFQKSSLTRHIGSEGHKRAIEIKSSRGLLKKSLQKAEEKADDSLTLQMRTVYFIAKNNIALTAL